MSSTSRMMRDDELRETYEEHQYRFANQDVGASAGTAQPSGPFRGLVLPSVSIGPIPSVAVCAGHHDCRGRRDLVD